MTLKFYECNAQDQKANCLIVLLHGYGANGEDLIEIARYWQKNYIPTAHIVCPNAPYVCEDFAEINSRQWFSLRELHNANFILHGAKGVLPILEQFIANRLKSLDLSPEHTILSGFSQGAMLSLYAGLYGTLKVRGIVGYSGWLTIPNDCEIFHKPHVMLIHGDSDDVIQYGLFQETVNFLQLHDIPVKSALEAGVGHKITTYGMKNGGRFIANLLH